MKKEGNVHIKQEVGSKDSFNTWLQQIGEFERISAEEEFELSKRIEKGDAEAEEKMLTANLRLVVSVAKRYKGRGVDLNDLVQEGNIGLMKATARYDYRKGYRFSTYATWWIRQGILRALAHQSKTFRVPVHMAESVKRYKRTKYEMLMELGREPNTREIAEHLEVGEDKVKEWEWVAKGPLSLETPVGDEEGSTVGDFVEQEFDASPTDGMEQSETMEEINRLVSALPEREAFVIRCRYGIRGKRLTLKQTGKLLGITEGGVRHIEMKALKRLKCMSRNETLGQFIG
ncbi:sigma-70 family RNA polymerase sigma factor (plasmid) [Pontibacillus sp. ALD_SL1]|uniref:sigma-70 family RNA polymerase sigma factor n=1 Tax=Pontibacillus sp. ALD_SL1 TaxID=2777185 RepID=UPI001A973BDA|nr:RNA polymerase sigma factor RpoD/SigA [Pontibacillus sp. ALD_SL1]QST02042.1 sigma-70 family RNA polymerase sigma factor [Pontibacillus sp. ALD_SL1]